MKKTWIALMLAVCLLLTTMAAASACCTDTSDMTRTQTMEERCPCMMDGKGVDGCGCTGDACGEDCACMGEEPCMKDGACTEDCQCAGSCNDIEAKMGMLEDELNAVFETNMALWEKFFGLMDKQPDMDTEYADYLMEQLDAAKEETAPPAKPTVELTTGQRKICEKKRDLGKAAFSKKQYADAIRLFSEAMEINPYDERSEQRASDT